MLSAQEVLDLLQLQPHPREGGYFIETYRSPHRLPSSVLPDGYTGDRNLSTAIYYLLTPETFSAMHRLPGDEAFHFYLGDPVEMLQLQPDGSGSVVKLGTDLRTGMRPQVIVKGGVWQGCRLIPGGVFALMGTTMAPGFDYADYETGDRAELLDAYPQFAELITALTPA